MWTRPTGSCWMRGREREREGGDAGLVHIIAGGWRRGECGSVRGECVRYSSTGGWTWIPAARRLPSLAKAAGEKAERGWPTCRRRSTLSVPKRGYKDCKGKAVHDVMEPIQPALSELWGDKVDRVMDACEPGRESINENLQQHGFGSLPRLACFLGETRSSVVLFDTSV